MNTKQWWVGALAGVAIAASLFFLLHAPAEKASYPPQMPVKHWDLGRRLKWRSSLGRMVKLRWLNWNSALDRLRAPLPAWRRSVKTLKNEVSLSYEPKQSRAGLVV